MELEIMWTSVKRFPPKFPSQKSHCGIFVVSCSRAKLLICWIAAQLIIFLSRSWENHGRYLPVHASIQRIYVPQHKASRSEEGQLFLRAQQLSLLLVVFQYFFIFFPLAPPPQIPNFLEFCRKFSTQKKKEKSELFCAKMYLFSGSFLKK